MDLTSKIALWRSKAADGTITLEEMKDAILALRQDRRAAAVSSATAKRAAAKATIPNAEDLLKELGL